MILTPEQRSALNFITAYAKENEEKCSELIDLILYQSNIGRDIYDQALDKIRQHATIALHFHPDRLTSNNLTVAKNLLLNGEYKNQFETEISSGSVSAIKGGNRDIWEEKIFGGSYHLPNVKNNDRPKYGSLNLTLTEDGPSSRFGSCYFLLKPEIKERSTFTYGDSYGSPKDAGTMDHFYMIMSALLSYIFMRNQALGENETDVLKFLTLVSANIQNSEEFETYRPFSHNLDFYIEAQVHGQILPERDIVALVADHSFKGTEVETDIKSISEKYNIRLFWHSGFQMKADTFPVNFRGPEMPEIAKRVSKNGIVNAYLIGLASNRIIRETNLWNDLGNKQELIQLMKYLWHCLVKFGEPIKKPK